MVPNYTDPQKYPGEFMYFFLIKKKKDCSWWGALLKESTTPFEA